MPYKDPERQRACQRKCEAVRRDVICARKRALRREHPEIGAGYYATHKAESKARATKWVAEHRDLVRERYKGTQATYRKTHPEQRRLDDAKRRALKYDNTPIDELLTEAQWRDILAQYHHRCAYCGRKFDKLTIDHVIPLAKGGKHSANNVVPACQHCNSVKNARTPEQWVGIEVCHV